jgi:hypothetical protein
VLHASDAAAQEGLERLRVLRDRVFAGEDHERVHVEAGVGVRDALERDPLGLRLLLQPRLVVGEEGRAVDTSGDQGGAHGGAVHRHPLDGVCGEAGELGEQREQDPMAVARRDRERLALEVLRRVDARALAHEDRVRRAPEVGADGFDLDVLVGLGGHEPAEIRAPRLALADGDALDGVAPAGAAQDLHVEPFLPVPALVERREVRRVLAVGQEIEDEGERAHRLRLRVGEREDRQQQNDNDSESLDHTEPPPVERSILRTAATVSIKPSSSVSPSPDGRGSSSPRRRPRTAGTATCRRVVRVFPPGITPWARAHSAADFEPGGAQRRMWASARGDFTWVVMTATPASDPVGHGVARGASASLNGRTPLYRGAAGQARRAVIGYAGRRADEVLSPTRRPMALRMGTWFVTS